MIYKEEDEILLKNALLMYQDKALSNLHPKEYSEKITFSEKFENKMQKLINAEKKPYYIIINTTAKKVACVIVALFVSLSAMMSVDAIREPFFRYIVETYEKYSAVYFKEKSQITPETFVTYAPEYIPEGYKEVKREGSADFMYNFITYFDENGNNIEFQQDLAIHSIKINTEGVEIEKIYINDIEAIYFENLGLRFILFADNNYSYLISCKKDTVSKNELIKISESIKPEKK